MKDLHHLFCVIMLKLESYNSRFCILHTRTHTHTTQFKELILCTFTGLEVKLEAVVVSVQRPSQHIYLSVIGQVGPDCWSTRRKLKLFQMHQSYMSYPSIFDGNVFKRYIRIFNHKKTVFFIKSCILTCHIF